MNFETRFFWDNIDILENIVGPLNILGTVPKLLSPRTKMKIVSIYKKTNSIVVYMFVCPKLYINYFYLSYTQRNFLLCQCLNLKIYITLSVYDSKMYYLFSLVCNYTALQCNKIAYEKKLGLFFFYSIPLLCI